MPRLLLINGSSTDRDRMIQELQRDITDLQVNQVLDAVSFDRALTEGNFDLVITDDQLHWNDGLTVFNAIKSRYPNCPVVLLTGNGHQKVALTVLDGKGTNHSVQTPQPVLPLPDVVRSFLKQTQPFAEPGSTEAQLMTLNTQLQHQVQQCAVQLQQVSEFEAALKRITDKVRDSFDEDYILQTVIHELTQTLNVNHCNAALYNLEDQVSTIRYPNGTNAESSEQRVMLMAEFAEGYHQLLQGQYFQWCNLMPDPDLGRMAILSYPIQDDRQIFGDLWIIDESSHIFSEQDVRLVEQVANQCAIALRQARLYQISQNQVQELERLNQLKNDFLSTVSHELRTPIANMKMAIQMLKLTPLPEKSQRYLEILQTQCDREAELVNDLLDLQRLEAAAYPSALGDAVRLPDWLPNLIEPFRLRSQQQQQTLELELQPNLPFLQINHGSLRRLLSELLNNACKYTPAGGKIILQVTCDPSSCSTSLPEHPTIVFTVKNQADIPATELPHIFEKFYRVPNADPWKQGGTGLGLALVQKLVEQLRGTIEVESNNGWTTFTLRFQHTHSYEQ